MKKVICCIVFVLLMTLAFYLSSHAETTGTFYATEDSPTYQAYPDNNWNHQASGDTLWTGNWWGNWASRSYLKFDLSEVPYVKSATLSIYNVAGSPGPSSLFEPAVVNTYLTSNSWGQSSITWNNQPVLGLPGGSTTVDNTCGWYSWDVTNLAKAAKGGSLSLALNSEGSGHTYYGKDNLCGISPKLNITAAPEPISTTLFLLGGAALLVRQYRKRKIKNINNKGV